MTQITAAKIHQVLTDYLETPCGQEMTYVHQGGKIEDLTIREVFKHLGWYISAMTANAFIDHDNSPEWVVKKIHQELDSILDELFHQQLNAHWGFVDDFRG